jgi:mono/diheme cytochrome c family protein
MPFLFISRALGLGVGLALCMPMTSHAENLNPLAMRGKAILQEKCGRCHAIEATGDSPLAQAPPMRTIYRRFNPKELQAELIEGKASRHKEMPQISFSDEDVYAIMTYLYVIRK